MAETSEPTLTEPRAAGADDAMPAMTSVAMASADRSLTGSASGVFNTARQSGGALGTAVLGAVMSAKIAAVLPASWHAAHLPALSAAQLAGVKSAVSVGAAPATAGTPPQLAAAIARVSHATFAAGMHDAFLVAAAVALVGAVVALLAKGGNDTAAVHAGI